MQPRRTSSGTFMYNFHDLRTAEAMHPYLYIYMPIVALISYLQFGVIVKCVQQMTTNTSSDWYSVKGNTMKSIFWQACAAF